MNALILVTLGCILVFIVIPAVVLTLYLTGHHEPDDFDINPSMMDNTPYEAWREAILQNIEGIREKTYTEVSIESDDHVRLKAHWYPGNGKTVILLHGYNSTPINNFAAIAMIFLEKRWSVLIPFMRGHGKSEGRSTIGLKEAMDAIQWAKWADSREACTDIVVYGMSMGGAAVVFASDGPWPQKVRALIADGGYYCVEKQVRAIRQMSAASKTLLIPVIRIFAETLLQVDIRKDGLQVLRRAKVPMCFVAGMNDETVLPDVVETCYHACSSEKKLIMVEGAPHTLSCQAGGERFKSELLDFVNKFIENGEEFE